MNVKRAFAVVAAVGAMLVAAPVASSETAPPATYTVTCTSSLGTVTRTLPVTTLAVAQQLVAQLNAANIGVTCTITT